MNTELIELASLIARLDHYSGKVNYPELPFVVKEDCARAANALEAAQAEALIGAQQKEAMLKQFHHACDERDAALARLAELEKQEPLFPADELGSVSEIMGCPHPALFAAAGASPEPSALQAANEELITALAACRDAFPVPDAGSRLDDWYCSAMADPLEVPEYVKACVGASPVQPSQAGELSDEEIDDVLDAAHKEATANGQTNGGMVGHLWNHIAARAIIAAINSKGTDTSQKEEM